MSNKTHNFLSHPDFDGTYSIEIPVKSTIQAYKFGTHEQLNGKVICGIMLSSELQKLPSGAANLGTANTAVIKNTYLTLVNQRGDHVVDRYPIMVLDPQVTFASNLWFPGIALDFGRCELFISDSALIGAGGESAYLTFYYKNK